MDQWLDAPPGDNGAVDFRGRLPTLAPLASTLDSTGAPVAWDHGTWSRCDSKVRKSPVGFQYFWLYHGHLLFLVGKSPGFA